MGFRHFPKNCAWLTDAWLVQGGHGCIQFEVRLPTSSEMYRSSFPWCHVVHKPLHVLCKAPSPRAWGKLLTCITPSSPPLQIPGLPTGGQRLLSRCKICPSCHHFMACLLCRIWVPSLAKPRSRWFWSPSNLLLVRKTCSNQRVRCPHKSQQVKGLQWSTQYKAHNERQYRVPLLLWIWKQ